MIIDRSAQIRAKEVRMFAKHDMIREWHQWFAWHPVQLLPDHSGKWLWLEVAQRRWRDREELKTVGYTLDARWEYQL